MNRYRLVVADYDGTMVNLARQISPRMIRDLEQLHAQGYQFGMASGRQWQMVMDFARKWGLSFSFDLAIGMNGQELYDAHTGVVKTYDVLPPGAVAAILKMMEPLDLTMQFYDGKYNYVSRIDDEIRASMARNHTADTTIVLHDVDAVADARIPKLIYRIPNDAVMQKVRAHVAAHPSPLYHGVETNPDCFEFNAPGVNKGVALQDYCRSHGIPLDQVIAFGDTTNDNEMLAVCHGVCLKNGSDDTKACAAEITELDNEHQGMEDYLEKHLLKRSGSELRPAAQHC
jgi:Cof subfamily protein (haloacid dehalogenase superfamily)